jgi:hypothetical protein
LIFNVSIGEFPQTHGVLKGVAVVIKAYARLGLSLSAKPNLRFKPDVATTGHALPLRMSSFDPTVDNGSQTEPARRNSVMSESAITARVIHQIGLE